MESGRDDFSRFFEEERRRHQRRWNTFKKQLVEEVMRAIAEALGDYRLIAGRSSRRGNLTTGQQRALKKIKHLGDDARAMQTAQELLDGLEGPDRDLTEPFVQGLRLAFREREWGFVCTCEAKEPASPLWKPDPSCLTGGRMLLSHTDRDTGKPVQHSSHVTLPKEMHLTEKPDRRRKRK